MQNDFRSVGSRQPASSLKPKLDLTKTEPTTPFMTPNQIQAHETDQPTAVAADTTMPRGSGHHWFNMPWPPTRHELILAGVILLVASIGVVGFLSLKGNKPTTTSATAKSPVVVTEPVITTVASSLSGLPVQPEVNQRPVVGVMIENSAAARPQSGLSQAGVVFEAIAEGGITRFLALFQDDQATNVGPVRSARPYYVQWSEGFRAAYAHVGGSPDALANIKSWNVQDLNQFYNAAPFHRVSSRAAPHNMYTSIVDLAALASQKGYKSDYTPLARKAASASKQPTASKIDISISSALYNVHYDYDATANNYKRSEGSAPQTDSNSGAQLSPAVVIAMAVPLSAGAKTAQGGAYSNYNPLGSGAAVIFQDGIKTDVTWHKADNTSQLTFTDAAGKPVALNPGQTWISVVDSITKVSHS